MAQKYGHRAGEADAADILICTICGAQGRGNWSWTDLHGEAFCIHCGCPHQLIGEIGCNLKDEWIPIVKEYWAATKKPCGIGVFLIERDYPDQIAAKEAFFAWVKEHHPTLMRKPKIFCWCNNPDAKDSKFSVFALAEDGEVLAHTISSGPDFFRRDIGIGSESNNSHYRAHFTGGYELVWLEAPRANDGFLLAYAKNQELGAKALPPAGTP